MSKPQVGDTVWLKCSPIGQPQKRLEIAEHFILSVGRKYFTISGNYGKRFKISDGMQDTDLNSYGRVYFDRKILEDEQEYGEKDDSCSEYFKTWRNVKPTLEQLRAIHAILYPPEVVKLPPTSCENCGAFPLLTEQGRCEDCGHGGRVYE